MTRRLVGILTAVMAAAPGSLLFADDKDKSKDNDDNHASDKKFSFAIIGDQPYAPTTGSGNSKFQSYPSPKYESLIARINADEKVEFTVHVGDIKAGDTWCNDLVYTQNLAYFNSFKRAVIFTPGDNEWTDCHRANNGGFDPLNRLALLRSVFYPNNQSLGQKKRTLIKQTGYVENSIWIEGPVVFVTIHQPGSNNNLGRTAAMDAEYAARNAANMAWLDQAFTLAGSDSKIRGVVILAQANPFERYLEANALGVPSYAVSGFADFINNVRGKALASPNLQVLYAGGDTHFWRIDKPLTTLYPAPCSPAGTLTCPSGVVLNSTGTRVMNFTRTEVFAQNDVHWTKVTVDKENPNLFTLEPQIVPGN